LETVSDIKLMRTEKNILLKKLIFYRIGDITWYGGTFWLQSLA
jgi:hypothetical protein